MQNPQPQQNAMTGNALQQGLSGLSFTLSSQGNQAGIGQNSLGSTSLFNFNQTQSTQSVPFGQQQTQIGQSSFGKQQASNQISSQNAQQAQQNQQQPFQQQSQTPSSLQAPSLFPQAQNLQQNQQQAPFGNSNTQQNPQQGQQNLGFQGMNLGNNNTQQQSQQEQQKVTLQTLFGNTNTQQNPQQGQQKQGFQGFNLSGNNTQQQSQQEQQKVTQQTLFGNTNTQQNPQQQNLGFQGFNLGGNSAQLQSQQEQQKNTQQILFGNTNTQQNPQQGQQKQGSQGLNLTGNNFQQNQEQQKVTQQTTSLEGSTTQKQNLQQEQIKIASQQAQNQTAKNESQTLQSTINQQQPQNSFPANQGNLFGQQQSSQINQPNTSSSLGKIGINFSDQKGANTQAAFPGIKTQEIKANEKQPFSMQQKPIIKEEEKKQGIDLFPISQNQEKVEEKKVDKKQQLFTSENLFGENKVPTNPIKTQLKQTTPAQLSVNTEQGKLAAVNLQLNPQQQNQAPQINLQNQKKAEVPQNIALGKQDNSKEALVKGEAESQNQNIQLIPREFTQEFNSMISKFEINSQSNYKELLNTQGQLDQVQNSQEISLKLLMNFQVKNNLKEKLMKELQEILNAYTLMESQLSKIDQEIDNQMQKQGIYMENFQNPIITQVEQMNERIEELYEQISNLQDMQEQPKPISQKKIKEIQISEYIEELDKIIDKMSFREFE